MTPNQTHAQADDCEAAQSKNKIDVATELRQRITYTLRKRAMPDGTLAARVEDRLKHRGYKLWAMMKKRPLVGVLLVGGAGLAIATTIGVGEITFAALAGYAAYEVLREGVPPAKVAEEMMGMRR